ncbi:hypothetical protein CWB89_05220 [Pseudoalteromonas piscicida]|uniref:Uncharacterized protein n=1 Tax=Pseudoalteromonas piscicida TaxID=43662 RepID=A0AAQ2EXK1_PSEO7|nr:MULTISPECIES: hypothetical protein [Pseudoalteromonas]KJY89719.1 hypothetical protein TW75_09175 [Pseudoalteromonas piscicida]TMN36540.1 hypothetical protein CWB94_18730 [Pseudoalteromonas piscicida]TMN40068.1 hypothetical protein CWB95_11470 [Pseudoalteromonas piscicida]TMN54127.1 hypothetical protein CWB92_07290 [Pseudoalteromonas piscicida]TMN55911.1 hypothetical protein CWB93_11390 [Pseudoalteromonas piscicida]
MESKSAYLPDSILKLVNEFYDANVVNVILPLKLYEISINNRVLNELGELSRFILSVMGKHNLTTEDILEVTGLSDSQIRPVVDRLKALGFITHDENELSGKGQRLAYILMHIHGQKLSLFIDQNYTSFNHDWFIVLEDNSILEEVTDRDFQVPLPRGIGSNAMEDCFKQSQRFKNNYSEVLPKLLPEFSRVIDKSDCIWKEEWDVTFKAKSGDKRMGVPIELELKEFNETKTKTESNDKKLRLYTELLRLNVEFSMPKGINLDTFESIEPFSFIYSDNDQKIYRLVGFESNPNEDQILYSQGGFDEQKSALLLLEHSIKYIDENMQLYSRTNSFDKVWQPHEFSYDEVIRYITDSEIIRVKYESS